MCTGLNGCVTTMRSAYLVHGAASWSGTIDELTEQTRRLNEEAERLEAEARQNDYEKARREYEEARRRFESARRGVSDDK